MCFAATAGETVPEWYGRVRTVIAHIDAHYAEPLANADLAAIAKMSLATFCRVFTATMQTTPAKYLTTIRLNAARRLLTTTDRRITDIAAETGFCDHSHFIKTFRAATGLTPNEFRRSQ